jgi:membrane protein insertase Oxa1/YidC/SpoIIIJ
MAYYYSTLGVLISRFSVFGCAPLGISLFAVAVKLLTISITNRYYKNIKIGEALKPQLDKIDKKYENNRSERSDRTTELLMHARYSPFGGIVNLVIYALLGWGLSGTLMDADRYLSFGAISLNLYFIQVTDIPARIFTSDALIDAQAAEAVVVLLLVVALQIAHDRMMNRLLVVDEGYVNKAAWVLLMIGLIFLPVGVALYWGIITIVNFAQITLIKRFFFIRLDVNPRK